MMTFSFRRLITFAAGGSVLGYYCFGGRVFSLPSKGSIIDSADRNAARRPDMHNMTLKCVQVFFRHGARTPLRQVPGLKEVKY